MYSGKAAMQLMGDWDVSSMLGLNKGFVTGGNLGLAPFPAVEGGSGDPADLAGNTASYVAISSKATAAQKAVAEAFFQEVLASPQYAKASGRRGRGTGHQGRDRPVRRAAAGLLRPDHLQLGPAGAELPVLVGPGGAAAGGDADAG